MGPLFEGSEPVWPDRLRPVQKGPDLIGKDWGLEMGFERFWPEGLRRAQDPQKRGHFWGLSRSGALLAGMGRYWQIGANSSGKDWGFTLCITGGKNDPILKKLPQTERNP